MATAILGSNKSYLGNVVLGRMPAEASDYVEDVGETVATTESAEASQNFPVNVGEVVSSSEAVSIPNNVVTDVFENIPFSEDLVVLDKVTIFETVSVHATLSFTKTHLLGIDITVPFAEGGVLSAGATRVVTDSVAISEAFTDITVQAQETIPLSESCTIGTEGVSPIDRGLRVLFTSYMSPDGLTNPDNYAVTAITGYPIRIEEITPLRETIQSGSACRVLLSGELVFTDATVPFQVGRYLDLGDGAPAKILTVAGSTVTVDRYLPPSVRDRAWSEVVFLGVSMTTTKSTNDQLYQLSVRNLKTATAVPVVFQQDFIAVATKPRLVSVEPGDDGQLLLTFSEAMRADNVWASPEEYTITGTTETSVLSVHPVNATQVILKTLGLGAGAYTVEVNASGTPHDMAGNPMDPLYNAAIFTGSVPITVRSVFTDKGPIAKPLLTLLSGTGVTIESPNVVTLTGAVILPAHVGLYVQLSGSTVTNDGLYRIAARLSATRVRLVASLSPLEMGSLAWAVIDERNGQVADDPSDVTVTVNGTPVTPDAVIGLLGQVVLPTTPTHGDDVQVGYAWVPNPTLEFRRLNSKEFRLNCWNRDQGVETTHRYRFNNTLIQPGEFNPLDLRALLAQPLAREMHYRGLERGYTAALNDPNLLLLNTPSHHIAYPPMQRYLSNLFVPYEALTLPEADVAYPWERIGTGTATVSAGILTIVDDSSGIFPTGQPIFWRRDLDLTFPAVFAVSWRMTLTAPTAPDGVFTGVAAGFADEEKACIVGFLLDGTTRKFGILVDPSNPADPASWSGSIATAGTPVEIDWSLIHSYRILRDRDGTVRVYIDGSITEILRLTRSQLPPLEALEAPFDALQGVFFGAISRPAKSTSTWDFIRYLVLPTNPQQAAPSIFVSYEATQIPESSTNPWTPVGSHGTETITGADFLLLDSTSATDADAGLVNGDFRGFVRMEPLLAASSDNVLDVDLQVRTITSGITPNAVMAAMDDGTRLIQFCLFTDEPSPKFSYGGRVLPTDFTPYTWLTLGAAGAAMVGPKLRITDTSTSNGRIYYVQDSAAPSATDRVISGATDYIYEFRCKVISHTAEAGPDPKFAGVFSQVYDGTRLVGLMFVEVAGIRQLALHSDGVVKAVLGYVWDGQSHTYRVSKSTSGDLVSVFVDAVFIGSLAYSSFDAPATPDPVGIFSFGSATPSSTGALSVVDWSYANVWRVLASVRRYAGIWKGYDPGSLTGYHLPLKVTGRNATIVGNAVGCSGAQFISNGVVDGDKLVIDSGANKGVYTIAAVTSQATLTLTSTPPQLPAIVDFRVVKETDWTAYHRYRISRTPNGAVSVFLDSATTPMIEVGYSDLSLPSSTVGIVRKLSAGLPAIAFGAFDPENLSQTSWDYVRYGITRSPTEMRIVPHHELLNQWNVIASPEHLFTDTPHAHTGYMSCSTGVPPAGTPDFLKDAGLVAYTILGDDTPLVPQTQSLEVRRPTPVAIPVSALNRPEDVLNTDPDFVLNDTRRRVELVMPEDVLYNCLEIIEQDTGEPHLVTSIDDDGGLGWGTFSYTGNHCLEYLADVLPEDTESPTPWELVSDDPTQVMRSVSSGILTYSIGSIGTCSIYRNATPLPDAPGLETTASFRVRVLNDTTLGLGDTQIRVGISFPEVTAGLAFVTLPMGGRYVLVIDLNTGETVGGILFDYLDGAYHTYRMVKDVQNAALQVYID